MSLAEISDTFVLKQWQLDAIRLRVALNLDRSLLFERHLKVDHEKLLAHECPKRLASRLLATMTVPGKAAQKLSVRWPTTWLQALKDAFYKQLTWRVWQPIKKRWPVRFKEETLKATAIYPDLDFASNGTCVVLESPNLSGQVERSHDGMVLTGELATRLYDLAITSPRLMGADAELLHNLRMAMGK